MAAQIDLSVVVPAYNEAERIGATLSRISGFLAERGGHSEIVVVDDGSSDSTAGVVEDRFRQIPMNCTGRLEKNGMNRGKGYSVRRGVLASKGSEVIFTDADLSAPIEEAGKLLDPITEGRADVAIGSRALNRSLIGVHQSKLRELAGRSFNQLVHWIFDLDIQDTQCGFKAFSRRAADAIFPGARVDGFGFDVELLHLAKRLGLRILEVPVAWNHAERSKVRMLRDSARMFEELWLIRWYETRGYYPDSPRARERDAP